MTANLMEAVSGLVTPDLVQKAAGASGESPEGTRASLLGAVPTLFAGLAHKASTPKGATEVFGLVTRAASKPKELGGPGLLSSIFGSRADQVTDALAGSSGVRRNSAAAVLALMGPLVLSVLGKDVMSRGLSAGGLTDLLFSHKKAILDNPNVPRGLGEALGVGNLSELGGAAAAISGPTVSTVESHHPVERPVAEARAERVGAPAREPVAARRASRWPMMLLPALLLGVLALWGLSNMFRGRPQGEINANNPTMRQPTGVQEPQATQPQVTEPARPQAAEPPAPAPAAAPKPGRAEAALPSDLKFHFDSGSTRLTPDSTDSVDSLLSYLQENPTARIRIQGFADTNGNPTANEALSVNRARALRSILVSRGIQGSRVETTGMGQDHPVASSDNAPDRAQNQRAEVTLIH